MNKIFTEQTNNRWLRQESKLNKKSHTTGQSSNYAVKSIVIKIVKIEKKMTLVFSTMLKLWGCLLILVEMLKRLKSQ